MEAPQLVGDLIFGRWRSQILHAGVSLGVFDALASAPASSSTVAKSLELDDALCYRLMRALACIGLLTEGADRIFTITEAGSLLTRNHPESMRGVALLEEGSVHYAFWKHLPDMVREGKQDGFRREFGCGAFEYTAKNDDYRDIFNEAMSSFSRLQTAWTLDALRNCDFSAVKQVCDVAGGYGHLLCHLLQKMPNAKGTVVDLPNVVEHKDLLWAGKMGLEKRVSYVPGNMFESVPAADTYTMKMILHDWNDDECVQILKNCHKASTDNARLFVIEHLVTPPDTPHFAKLFDIHMMCWGTGRERTPEEYANLMGASGWQYVATHHPQGGLIGVVEGRRA